MCRAPPSCCMQRGGVEDDGVSLAVGCGWWWCGEFITGGNGPGQHRSGGDWWGQQWPQDLRNLL